jgi:hypothetical protein
MKEQTYKAIDLNLPSGIKWADRNIGAETPQDNGMYFSWGNVDGHAIDENGKVTDGYSFDRDTYATTSGGQYTACILNAEHDAATVNMGEEWCMPTSAEIRELIQETDHYYISEDTSIVSGPFNYENKIPKKEGYKKLHSICFVKKGEEFNYNDRSNFIEFPFAGICSRSLLDVEYFYGYVWSNSVLDSATEYARNLILISDGRLYGDNCFRFLGHSIRGVTFKQ